MSNDVEEYEDMKREAEEEARQKKAVVDAFWGKSEPATPRATAADIIKEDEEAEDTEEAAPQPHTMYPNMDVYTWTQNLSSEQSTPYDKDYLWSTEAKRLLRRLKLTSNNMIAIIANQGVGKTATHANLALELQDYGVNSFKWGSDATVFEAIGTGDIMTKYQDAAKEAATEKMRAKGVIAYRNYDFDREEIKRRDSKWAEHELFRLAERTLTKRELAKCQHDAIVTTAVEGKVTFIIDFPDYDKKNRSQMLKDLTAFREWWDTIIREDQLYGDGVNVNIVIFFQKELWGSHFAFGKFDVTELKPFKAAEIVEYYAQQFKGYAPFTGEALTYLAGLARGIMRWFKKYVRVCLDNYYDIIGEDAKKDGQFTISLDSVKEWITVAQLAEDWDRELIEVMPKSRGMRLKAVEIMRYLYECGGATQADITAKLFGDDSGERSQASRLISKLELYGYVKRVKQGRENLIQFAQS